MLGIEDIERAPSGLSSNCLPMGSIQVLYGTQTGNSEELARETAKKLGDIGLPVRVAFSKFSKIGSLSFT